MMALEQRAQPVAFLICKAKSVDLTGLVIQYPTLPNSAPPANEPSSWDLLGTCSAASPGQGN